MKTKNLGFTLVELIVVITILAILGTIGFISLEGYSAQARDAKRISDTSSLLSKINIEVVKGTPLSSLVIEEKTNSIIVGGNEVNSIEGRANFDNLRETAGNFKDPRDNTKDYKIAYLELPGQKFYEIATISEVENKTKILGNYYKIEEEDSESLFGDEYYNNSNTLIYEVGTSNPNNPGNEDNEEQEIITYTCQNPEGIILENTITNNTENLIENINYQNIDNTQSCYYTCRENYGGDKCDGLLIYGDEGEEEIAICNKWVEENIGDLGGGYQNWLWVPARHFTTDGNGIGMKDEYYKREITYNGINYICNGFAVAKYEMSYEEVISPNSNGGGLVDYNTVKYVGTGLNGGIVSIPNRYPIADITQPQAISACRSIGLNIEDKGLDFHLITNNEWMAIARNIEQKANNWSGGSVGNGYISNGLSNSGLGCSGHSKTIYTTGELTLPRTFATKTGIGEGIGTNTACDEKRQLTLSNNQTIWDLSGNVWEHVNKANTIDGSGNNTGMTKIDDNRDNWNIENNGLSNEYYQWHKYGWSSESITANERAKYGPSNANYSHTIHGVGNIYGWYINYPNSIFLRGGTAYNTSSTGIFALILARGSEYMNRFGGFRCSL